MSSQSRTAHAPKPTAPEAAHPAAGLSKTALWGGALLLAVAVFGAYFAALSGEFVYDDLLVIQQNPQITSLANIPEIFGSSYWDFVDAESASHVGYYRPLTMVLVTLAYVAGDGEPWVFHLFSLAVYAGACFAAWRFAARLLRSEGAGFWAALLFALHPLHVESVAWISALHDPLFALFGFVALESFLRWRDEGSQGLSWKAGLWLFLALLSKDAAVALVPVALVCDWGRGHERGAGLRRWLSAYVPFAAALLVYYGARALVFGDLMAGFDRQTTDFGVDASRLALLRVELLGGAAWLLAWPAELNLFRPFQPELPEGAPSLVIGLAGSAAFVLLVLVAWIRRWRPALALLLLIPAALLPVLLRVESLGTFPLSDRFLFVPVLGFTGLVAHLAWRRLPRPAATGLLLFIAAALGVRTALQIPHWANEEALFRRAVEQNQRNPNVHWGLGRVMLGEYAKSGLSDHLLEARDSFQRSMDLLEEAQNKQQAGIGTDIFATYDDHLQTNLGLGHAMLREAEVDGFHDYESVRVVFQRVIESQPKSERGYIGLGTAWLASGDPNEAGMAFRKAIQLNPNSPEAHFNMGVLLMRIEEWAEAAEEFRRCLELRNNNRKDLVFLARALVEAGQDEQAAGIAREARRLYPEDSDPMVLLGTIAARAGRSQEALDWFDRALERSPDYGAAHLRRGKVLVQLEQRLSAARAFERACELLPSSFDAHYNLAVLILDSTTPERGVPYFMVAYRLRPADFAKRMRDAAEAIHRDDVTTLVMLATIDADRGELTTARSWIERALEVSPEDGPSNYIYGALLRKLEAADPTLALAPLRVAAEQLPTSYQAQFELADLLLQLRREGEAGPYLSKALLLLDDQGMAPAEKAKTREAIQTALRKIDEMAAGPLPNDG